MNSEKSRIYGASFISRTWIGYAGGNNPERILAAIFHGYKHLTAPGMPWSNEIIGTHAGMKDPCPNSCRQLQLEALSR